MPNEPISMQPQEMPSVVHEPETNYSAPLKAVRQHCLSCCNGSFVEVNVCSAKSCPLWSFADRLQRINPRWSSSSSTRTSAS
jgi:hypothetical protein